MEKKNLEVHMSSEKTELHCIPFRQGYITMEFYKSLSFSTEDQKLQAELRTNATEEFFKAICSSEPNKAGKDKNPINILQKHLEHPWEEMSEMEKRQVVHAIWKLSNVLKDYPFSFSIGVGK